MSKTKHRHDRQDRRSQFTEPRPRRSFSWNVVIIAAAVVFVGVVALNIARGSNAAPSTTVADASTGVDFTAAAASLADGKARFFQYVTAARRTVRFFMMKSSDGVVRAAADACTVCYRERKGYRQVGDAMVCNNCGKSFPSVDINVVTGGCNPIPLNRTVDGDRIVVRAADLEQAAEFF